MNIILQIQLEKKNLKKSRKILTPMKHKYLKKRKQGNPLQEENQVEKEQLN